MSEITDDALLYAALLALTQQNVIVKDVATNGAIMGDAIIYAEGWVITTPYIIGNIGA